MYSFVGWATLMRPVMVFLSFYLPITISNWAILYKIQIRICIKQGFEKMNVFFIAIILHGLSAQIWVQYLIMIVILKCFQNIYFGRALYNPYLPYVMYSILIKL